MIDPDFADAKPIDDPAHVVDKSSPPIVRTINSADLFHGALEVLIQHNEKTYRLRVTRNGKLILVK